MSKIGKQPLGDNTPKKRRRVLAGKTAEKQPPVREPSAKEVETREALREHFKKLPARAEYKVENNDGQLHVSPRGDEKLYGVESFVAVGSTSMDFMQWQANSAVSAIAGGRADRVTEQNYNAAMSIMAAVQPENELEALLASQMIAANHGAMLASGRFARAEYTEHAKMYGGLANKFMRTFAAQMEQLRKMRTGGEQIIKHVHVHEGGQAVIAGRDVNNIKGGGGEREDAGQCHAAAAVSGSPALLGSDAPIDLVPIPGNAERALQDARRDEPGGAEG